MKKVTPITERFQHFVEEIKEGFWGDVYQQGRASLKKFWEAESERQRQRYLDCDPYQRSGEPFTRDQHPTSGADFSRHHRGSGQRPDGFNPHPEPGSNGETIPPGLAPG